LSSLGEDLRVILPRLGEALVSREGGEAVLAVADRLPGDLARAFGFECRLGRGPSRPGFLVTADPEAGGRELLAAEARLGAHCPGLSAHPAWKRIHRFAAGWTDPGAILARGTEDVRLAFLLDDSPGEVPAPGLFFRVRPMAREARGDRGPASLAILDAGVRALEGRPLSGRRRAVLLDILEALPPGATVVQAGFPAAQTDPAIRLGISGLGGGRILLFLHRAG
jgi:hypothetical protein